MDVRCPAADKIPVGQAAQIDGRHLARFSLRFMSTTREPQ
jgi:hypothetical protein